VISPRTVRITGFVFLLFGCRLVTAAAAQPVCLNVQTADASAHHPIAVDDELYLAFPHSLYGSKVEEYFRVTAQGLQLLELRYADPRLVEFYGHESAANEDGWWVVRKLGPVLNILDLHVSPGSWIGVIFGTEKLMVKHDAPSDGRARLALSECPRSHHG
jgi:hypothetical protein